MNKPRRRKKTISKRKLWRRSQLTPDRINAAIKKLIEKIIEKHNACSPLATKAKAKRVQIMRKATELAEIPDLELNSYIDSEIAHYKLLLESKKLIAKAFELRKQAGEKLREGDEALNQHYIEEAEQALEKLKEIKADIKANKDWRETGSKLGELFNFMDGMRTRGKAVH